MNPKQKLVRLFGLLALVGIAIFPPWQFSYFVKSTGTVHKEPVGHHPIWNPPEDPPPNDPDQKDHAYKINVVRLSLQLVGVLVLLNVGIYVLKERPE